jgi:hypothetical protein
MHIEKMAAEAPGPVATPPAKNENVTEAMFNEFPTKINAYFEKIDKLVAEYNAAPFPVWVLDAITPNVSKWAFIQDKYGYSKEKSEMIKSILSDEGDVSDFVNTAATDSEPTDNTKLGLSTLMTFWLLSKKQVDPKIFENREKYLEIVHNTKDPANHKDTTNINVICHDAWAMGTMYELSGKWESTSSEMMTTLTKKKDGSLKEEQLVPKTIMAWRDPADKVYHAFPGGFICQGRHASMMVEFDDLIDYGNRQLDCIMAAILLKMSNGAVYTVVNRDLTLADFFKENATAAGGAPKKTKHIASSAVKAKAKKIVATKNKKKKKPQSAK